MKHTIKKVMAVFLAVTVLCTGSQSSLTNVQATESPDFIDVSASSSSLRTGPGKANSPLAEVSEGRVLKVIDQCTNEHDHIWYEVAWENEPGDALVLGAASTAGVTSVADGPLPVGEMIGAILIAGTICLSLSGVIPNELQKVTTKVDFVEYLKNNGKMCTDTNFRMVGRDDVTVSMFPDLKLLFIFEHDTQEVFSRVCNGEARGIPWETISHYCDVLEDAINDYL